MSKALLQLKVVHTADQRASIPVPRLCDLCGNGAVLRGHARATESAETRRPDQMREEVICLFLGRVIEIDVTECNRFVDRVPAQPPVSETAWVA